MNQFKSQQRGVALIIVLLIVAIVSVLATEMGSRLQLQIKRASNIKENTQAYWYAMGAEQYARKSIKQLIKLDGEVIHLEQQWNQEFAYPIEGGGIQAQLMDMQSCFNLNALREPQADANNATSGTTATTLLPERMLAFERLLQNVDPAIPSYNIDMLRDSLVDWLDQNESPTGFGVEDSEYESLQFPYVAANNYMVHKSELRLINGVEVSWLRELLKLVCVLPNDSLFLINVNTVSEENAAIISAATGLPLTDAQSLLANRGSEGYQTTASFLEDPSIQALEPKLSEEQKLWFDVKTSHFILHTKTKYNDATFAMQTLFKVDSNNNVNAIRRDFSGF
ncbi:type II secretion system minor pseudopilin GspK [uncultured Paraglaciecola sp.]|uniref:type II secretion system minor pseudopilin GspK n=1 Tax=uncultured Paraglaciecola sp. TaxID=1765024 RepID=UPI0030DDBA0E|tara:strand:- start:118168 stop:119181 length:1014 start_codon:yes stop_codon:yes gene_type:complete